MKSNDEANGIPPENDRCELEIHFGALWMIIAVLLACAFFFWAGYKSGQCRPRITTTEHYGGRVVSCGWDAANRCVALWQRDTNGITSWMRLSE